MATSTESSSEQSDLQCLPHSRASPAAENDVVRSRTWSEDITRTWNVPIHGLESLQERTERYCHYFDLNGQQLKCIYQRFINEMNVGLELHRMQPTAPWDGTKCSLKMMDTCILNKWLPRGRETGSAIALDFGSREPGTVHAAHVSFKDKEFHQMDTRSIQLRDICKNLPKGLLDKHATACQLFDALASLIKIAFSNLIETTAEEKLQVVFSLPFPVEQRCISSASLIHWTGGFETGRATIDPVEGTDLDALLNCAFYRMNLEAQTQAVINDTAATLLCSMYEKKPRYPPCAVAIVLGAGINGCYNCGQSAQTYNYKSSLIDCQLGNFDKSLPANDVDLEIDFADEATKGLQLFEKMVSTAYLGELCRRLILKVYQSNAPPLAWVRYSMPWFACAKVIMDSDESMEATGKILTVLWDWETHLPDRKIVKNLFRAVFDRSAALAAVAVTALASQTERLQPAMGGLTCAIEGSLYSKCPFYAESLRANLPKVLDNNTSNLIHLQAVDHGALKGAAILSYGVARHDNEELHSQLRKH